MLGNHDYGHSLAQRRPSPTPWPPDCETLDVHVLAQRSGDVAGLQVAGVDDLWANRLRRRADAGQAATATARRSRFATIPTPPTSPIGTTYRGWILSGHTHGGQCKPPFLPPPLLPVKNRRYTAGEFEVGEGRRLYINRGLGYLRRVRFNVRPEITVFKLA